MAYNQENTEQYMPNNGFYQGNSNMDPAYYPQQQMDTSYMDYNQGTPQSSQFQYQYDYVKPTMSNQSQMPYQQDSNYQWPQNSCQDLNQPPQEYCSQQHDDFQKLQLDLLVDDAPMEQQQWDGQISYGDGELLPLSSVQSMETYNSPPVMNNNNNNEFIDRPWVPMAPLAAQLEPQTDQQLFLPPVAQLEPAPQTQTDPQLMAKIDEDLEKHLKKEKNKGYAAKCLANKKQIQIDKHIEAGETFTAAKVMEESNDFRQNLLGFAVEHVLPAIQSNNFDLEMFHTIEQYKQMIEEENTQEKTKDEEYQRKTKALQGAKTHLERCVIDNENKDTVPVFQEKNGKWKQISKKTIATRLCRAKAALEVCVSDRDALINQYRIQRHQKISELLDHRWAYFKPYIIQAFNDCSDRIFQQAQWKGQTDQMNYLHYLLFNPG